MRTFPRLSGGEMCLDFVNTIEPRVGEHPHDFLTSYADLVQWSQYAGLISEETTQELLEKANIYSEESAAIFMNALALRETIYRIFLALIHYETPASSDLNTLQSMFVDAMAHGHLTSTEQNIEWQWRQEALDSLLWMLSRSAVTLLTSVAVEHVKECPHAQGGCGWLFLDRSKNKSRLWCSEQECGIQVRMRRLYANKRQAKISKKHETKEHEAF